METKFIIIIGLLVTILICGALLTYGFILNNPTHEVIIIEKNNTNHTISADTINKDNTSNTANAPNNKDNNKNTKNNNNNNNNNNQNPQPQTYNDGIYHSPEQYKRIGEDVRNGREVGEVQSGWPNAGHWVYTDTGEEIEEY